MTDMINAANSSSGALNVAKINFASQQNAVEPARTQPSKEIQDTATISQAAIDACKAEKS
jgi:hypothetical protein